MKTKITSIVAIAAIVVLFVAFSSPIKAIKGQNAAASTETSKGSEPVGGFDAPDPK